jgi:hypothetical protein
MIRVEIVVEEVHMPTVPIDPRKQFSELAVMMANTSLGRRPFAVRARRFDAACDAAARKVAVLRNQ